MEWFQINRTEIPQLMGFDKLVHSVEDQPSEDDYIAAFDTNMTFYVLKSDSLDKYVATFQLHLSQDEIGMIIFTGVGVHPDNRNQGIGQKIFDKMEKLNKGKTLLCKTRPTSKNMKKLLRKNEYHNYMDELDGGDYWQCWLKKIL